MAGFESDQQQDKEDDQSGQQNQLQGIMHSDESSDDEELDSYERAWREYDSMLTQSLNNLGRGRGRGRRGRGRGTSPAEALAAAALRFVPVNASPEALQRWMSPKPSPVVAADFRRQQRAAGAAPLGTAIAGRSSDSILPSKGKAPMVEYINPEDGQDQGAL